MKSKKHLQLVFGFILLLFLGLIYAWSLFIAPLEQTFGWSRPQTSLTFTISMSFFCIGGILSGIISKKHSPRLIIRLSAVCMLIGFLLASRTNSLIQIYLTYGVLCGFGVGMGYNAILSTVIKWYPDKPGLCSGVLLMGFGFGGMLLGAGVTALIGTIAWRSTFVLLGVAFAVVLAWGAQVLALPPNILKTESSNIIATVAAEPRLNLSSIEMLKRPSFWLCYFWSVISSAIGLAVIGHAAPCAADIGATAATATIAVGIISICNGTGRVLFGSAFDILGRKKTMLIDSSLFFLSLCTLIGAVQLKSLFLLLLGYILVGFAYGGIPPTNSTYINRMYGVKNYSLNFSLLNSNIIFASILGPFLAGTLKMLTGTYLSIFVVLLALNVVSFAFILVIKRP